MGNSEEGLFEMKVVYIGSNEEKLQARIGAT
jgi:hypothetical protein